MSTPHAFGHSMPHDRSLARLQRAALVCAYPACAEALLAELDEVERVVVENTAHAKPLLDALMAKPEISRAGELLRVEERDGQRVAHVRLADGSHYHFTMAAGVAGPLVRGER